MANTETAGAESAVPSLDGWDIGKLAEIDWVPWGSSGNARAKIVAQGDGYILAYVEAEPGYSGDPHVHGYTEFSYIVSGTVRNQGREMTAGDAYVAATGSSHTDFHTKTGATYLSIFRL